MTAELSLPEVTQFVAIGDAAPGAPQSLDEALHGAGFDAAQVTHISWQGAPCATPAQTIAALAYIAALPEGSTLAFDYAAVQPLASRIARAGESDCVFIQPRALRLLLRSAGFRHIEERGGMVHASN